MRGSATILTCGLLLSACGPEDLSVEDPATYVAQFEVVMQGLSSAITTDPTIHLARSKHEAKRAVRRIGIEEVAQVLESWTRYRDRALIVVVGTNQPDDGSRLHVDVVHVPALISEVMVTARVDPGPTPAPPDSVPWTVVSVSADEVDPARECVLRLDEVEVTSSCVPIRT